MGDNGLLSPVFESTKVLSNLKKSRSLQYSSQLSVKLIWGYSFNGSERWPVKPMVVGSSPSTPANTANSICIENFLLQHGNVE